MARLGDICIQITDGSHNPPMGVEQSNYLMLSSKNIDDDYITLNDPRYLSQEDFEAENRRTNIKPNDLLITIVGTIGRVAIVPNSLTEFCVQRSVAVLKPKPEIVYNRFLMHYLQSMRPYLEQESRGVAQKGIYLKQLSNLSIILPPLDEQRKIAAVLDKVSDLIAKRRQQLDKLDEIVKSRFIEMFGDVIRNSKAWQMRVFEDVAASRLGKMLDAKQQTGKYSYPYLANFNVQWFRFNIENLNQMDFDEDDRAEFELKDGDLLVCEGGEIGRCAVWHNEIQPCFFQKALHRVRCNRQIIHPDYLAWWFKYNCDYDGFTAIAGSKATIAHLPGIKLKQLQVAVPPIELQEQFATFVEQTDKSKYRQEKCIGFFQCLEKSIRQEWL